LNCVALTSISRREGAKRVGFSRQTKRTTPQAWQFLISPQKNRWQALRAASEKAARQGDRFRNCADLVRFYAEIRTDFADKREL
jgi:hypothetical protein